jgi:hypothetical protein
MTQTSMSEDPSPPSAQLEALRAALGARAAGWWRVTDDRLNLVAFAPAPDLPAEVAHGFAEAARSVPITPSRLGIVRAALDGSPVVSRAAELPPEEGSGLWLRRFGAGRSVAVPVRDRSGAVAWVVSVALADTPPPDDAVDRSVADAAATWPGLSADRP